MEVRTKANNHLLSLGKDIYLIDMNEEKGMTSDNDKDTREEKVNSDIDSEDGREGGSSSSTSEEEEDTTT